MPQPNLTFDQALGHLRRGFILRIHGHDKYQGALLAEEQGVLAFSRGDYKAWQSVGDVPVLELVYDVYDQKKAPLVFAEAGMPVVPKATDMTEPPKFKVGDRVRLNDELSARITDQRGAVFTVIDLIDDRDGPGVIVRDQDGEERGYDPDEIVLDSRGVGLGELGGGNAPPNVEPDSVAAAPDTLGKNEAQVDQVPPPVDDGLTDEQLDQLTAPETSEQRDEP